MVALFILGAFIGSGAFLIVDLSTENKLLKDKIKTIEEVKDNEVVCSERD